MPPQAPASGPSPAPTKQPTYRDFVQQTAEALGIPASLAFSMIDQESRGRHRSAETGLTTSSAGAQGFFQLMPETAKSLGVDPADPQQNIIGGLRYFKQQLDAYKGDVRLALAAYNAGPGNVKDRVPDFPETQEYVRNILATWQQGGPAASAAAPAQPGLTVERPAPGWRSTAEREGIVQPGQETPGVVESLVQGFNPMTFEGRVNWAATAGGIAAGVVTRRPQVGLAARASILTAAQTAAKTGIAPWIIRVLGPPAAAGTAAGTLAAAETAVGTAPPGTSPVAVGGEQAAYEVGGQMFWWPVRRIGSGIMASGVGKRAVEALGTLAEDVRVGARDVKTAIRDRANEAVEAARAIMRSTSSGRPTGDVSAVATAARASGAPRVAATVEKVVQQELDAATELSRVERMVDSLVTGTPGRLGAGAVTKETLQGPTKEALDLQGARVAAAAADPEAPEIPWTPELSDALDDLVERYRPAAVFGTAAPEGTTVIGFGGRQGDEFAEAVARAQVGGKISREDFQRLLTQAKQTKNPYQLAGALGYLQRFKGESLPYDIAHATKRALDDSINWDQRARTTMQALTKHFRTELRRSMSGFEPYDTATAAYESLIKLHTKGVGRRMLRLANDPDGAVRLADVLKTGDAAQAQVVRSLLVDQAAAGGNPALGQRAWDSIRDVYTHDHLLTGPAATLSDRVRALATQNPEFARVVYGDLSGQKILSNLDALGQAYTRAATQVAEIKMGRAGALDAAKRLDLRAAENFARQQVKAVTALQQELRSSSLGAVQSFEQTIADVIRAVGLGPKSIWGALSIVRLFETASGPDLLRWAAYSDRNTQMLLKLLHGTGPERVLAGTARAAGTAAQSLHESAAPATPPVGQSPTASNPPVQSR